MNIIKKPSFYATAITGISIIIILFLYINNLLNPNNLNFLIFITLLSILIGIHGLLHLGLEIKYNFNPIDLIQNIKK
jgi:disulfide bond formation protein DsbB